MKRILCAGLAVADIPVLPVSASAFERDSINIEPLRVLTGGDALNEAIVLRRLGVDSALSACVGNDPWGECILSTLKAEGVDARFVVQLNDCPTTTSVVLIEPDGERHFLISRGSLERFTLRPDPAMKAYDIISIASLWGLPGLTLDALREFSAFAHENHIRITADFTQDMASMGLDYIRAALSLVDDLFPSLDEAQAITGEREPEAMLRALASYGPQRVVLKLGAQGSMALVDGKLYRQPSLAGRIVDTTGAGDNFVGAYLACMARDIDTARSLEIASRAAARCVDALGATGARYTFEELL